MPWQRSACHVFPPPCGRCWSQAQCRYPNCAPACNSGADRAPVGRRLGVAHASLARRSGATATGTIWIRTSRTKERRPGRVWKAHARPLGCFGGRRLNSSTRLEPSGHHQRPTPELNRRPPDLTRSSCAVLSNWVRARRTVNRQDVRPLTQLLTMALPLFFSRQSPCWPSEQECWEGSIIRWYDTLLHSERGMGYPLLGQLIGSARPISASGFPMSCGPSSIDVDINAPG